MRNLESKIRGRIKDKHIALIPDGNRRWAESRNLKVWKGHEEGAKIAEKFLEWCIGYGISTVSVYALSKENLEARSEEEVNHIYRILANEFKRFAESKKARKNEICIKALGDIENLPKEIKAAADYAMEKTKSYSKLTLNVLLQYSGRFEILEAAKKIAKDIANGRVKEEDLTEGVFENYLFINGEDPDLVIRTAEKRLSNFVLWQIAYSELFFTEKYWPDFTKQDFDKILVEFAERERRIGE